jgi:hypothetical protein
MPTLEQVWRAVFPQAHAVGAESALGRPVAWVRVLKARTPAFDTLEPNDLALAAQSTLGNLAALGVETVGVVDALVNAGAGGVVIIGDGDLQAGLAEPIVERARAAGLAAFTLSDGDVGSLERAAIGYVVNGRAELEARAATLERELERAALGGAGVDGIAATIARFLARAVAIEAADGEVLALHAPGDAPESAAHAAEYLRRRRRRAALRVALPGAGALVLLGSQATTELEAVVTRRISGFLAVLLGRAADSSALALERAAGGLPADGPPWVVLVARQIDETAPTTTEQRERLRGELRRAEPARRLLLRGDAASLELRIVAAPEPSDSDGRHIAERISRRLGRPVAVSPPFSEPAERAVVEAHARATLEAVEALPAAERGRLQSPDGSYVARADLAPAYRLAAGIAALPDAQRQAAALLQPLVGGRGGRNGDALATLRAVLDHDGLAEAATALGVHRNTLAYRLARIEERTGWRLADPMLRFSLGVALRIVQSAQEDVTESTPCRRRRVGQGP